MTSAIPVRRLPHGGRRSGVLIEVNANTQHEVTTHTERDKTASKHRKRSNGNSPSKPTPRQGMVKELMDENVRQKEDLKLKEARIKELHGELTDTKKKLQLSTSGSKEKNESLKDLSQAKDLLEVRCRKLEDKLLMSNIDPVTLKHMDPEYNVKDQLLEDYTKTKEQVEALKDWTQKLNTQSSHSLETLAAMDKKLEDINTEMDSILSS